MASSRASHAGRARRAVAALAVAVALACGGPSPRTVTMPEPTGPTPPIAEPRPHEHRDPHGVRVDPYHWLRDDTRTDPAVLGYLEAENAYAAAVLAPTEALQETLFQEMKGRIQEADTSVPTFDKGSWYYTRTEEGKQYYVLARRKGTMDAPEEILLDVDELAQGHEFYAIGAVEVSPDGALLAYGEDTVGRRQYTLRVKDLATGALRPDTATNIGSIAWANDGKTLFYVAKDPTTLRAARAIRHELGATTPPAVVFDEADDTFSVGVYRTKSDRFVVIASRSTQTSEARLVDADAPAAPPRVFLPRERDHLYGIDHLDGRFVIRTNWQAINFRVMWAPDAAHADRAAWRDVLAHRDDALVESVAVARRFLAVSERSGGLRRVRVIPAKGEPFLVDSEDPTFVMSAADTPDPDAAAVRYTYTSPTIPPSTYELDLATGERRLLKRQPVLGDFDPARYVAEYVHATAPDGTEVPISVVRRRDTPVDGTAPLLVYGYGSYGISSEPSFSSARLSLLDRGWAYAIAHVRGGQELGRRWYEDGKLGRKMNTFTDFVAATEHLVATGRGARGNVFAMGGSAGGLLVGAVVNLRPDLYRGVVAVVPFVDVVTTMLDTSIPLTTGEFDEWGDPREPDAYRTMLAYSPYDNVTAQAYPAMLVETGLWDSQVQYYEPAKWVAKLRATKTDANPLLLHTNLSAGHGGASGRFDRLREVAREYAFLLLVADLPDPRRR